VRIIRFEKENRKLQLAVVTKENNIYPLFYDDLQEIIEKSEKQGSTVLSLIQEAINESKSLDKNLDELTLSVPISSPEIWAAGVTYKKSRDARNYESTDGRLDATTFYDKVYDAKRPELFLKSTKDRTVGPNQEVYLRSDSKWQIPEPELGLVLDNSGKIIGYTVGNDMSCRDIEGENPLYLPQAKIWKNSCSIGPTIRLAETVDNPYDFQIICRIYRGKEKVFEDSTTVNQLKRRLEELSYYLSKDNIVFNGTVLLTGTCVVPSNDFSLEDKDLIEIEIPGIGILSNPVKAQ